MTKDEAMKLALKSIRELVVDESDDAPALQGVRMRKQKAEKALREALAQPEQELVGWRVTYSKVIKALAAIVTVHTPDNLFDLDAIPRDPVMGLVQQIRVAIDGYEPPQRKPLTDEHPLVVFAKECVLGAYKESELGDAARRAIEAAYNIKGEA